MLKHLAKEHLGDSKLVTLTLAGMLVALAVFVLLWPARDGQPIEQPVPAPVKPADLVSDTGSLDLAPVVGEMELEGRPAGESVLDDQQEPAGADAAATEDDPGETGDVDTLSPDPDLPDAAIDDGWPNQPRYPDTDKVIPPPRD